ncbi:YadA-like family protein [Pseudomonas sp. PDM23]|uniref:YadA-like family protein n=1 Tax=unclassified Pseudomonas TaxID=196821 RepID=UPI0017845DCA|nr:MULTISPECIES: YadA-like family protein [unclassified Pseudomonas]MBD9578696.1 YadA-like family protein [Pseudomonas sp. PDM23]MBD9674020.1 YadA-like family protein [Pseudomonas sp. PDM21]
MNRIYRLVWSRSRAAWCVASELTSRVGKSGHRGAGAGRPLKQALSLLALSVGLAVSGMAGAVAGNPGLYVNDSTDPGCIFVHDTGATGSTGWKYDGPDSGNENCLSNDKSTQTGRVLFYGTGSQADGSNSLTLGNELYVNGGRIGLNNKIDGSNSMAIGNVNDANGTSATGADAIAIGNNAQSLSQDASAFGTGAKVGSESSQGLAVGNNALVQGSKGIAIGNGAQTLSNDALTLGNGATVNRGATDSMALGNNSQVAADANKATALGFGANAQASRSTALGESSVAGAAGSVAMGSAAKVGQSATDSLALGSGSLIADGAQNAAALGKGATANANNSLALGTSAVTGATNSVALGSSAVVGTNSSNGLALGSSSQIGVGASNTVALGTKAMVGDRASNGMALGNGSSVGMDASNAIALGNASSASRSNSVAIGNGAQANGLNSIVLGANSTSTAGRSIRTETAYVPTGATSVAGSVADSEFSIGHAGDTSNAPIVRRLTNLAAGAQDTDGVNVSQLKALGEQVADGDAGAVKYERDPVTGSINYNKVVMQGDTYNSSTRTGGTRITNVARGADDSDAVNMSQLNETNENVTNVDNRVTQVDNRVTHVDNRVNNVFGNDNDANVAENGRGIRYVRTNDEGLQVDDAYAKGQGSTAVGYQAQATGKDALALGRNSNASADNSVALGAGSTTTANLGHPAYMAGGYPAMGNANGEVSVGSSGAERRITNLAAGADDTDAVNVSQLRGVSERAEQLSQDALLWDWGSNSFSATHHGNGPNKITNVAAGDINDNSTDAVNGSQLSATNTQVTHLGGRVTNVEGDVSNLGDHVENIYNTGTKYFHANSTGTDSAALGQDSVAIGMGAVSSHDGSVALGAGSVADGSTLGHQAYLVGGSATGEVNVGNRRVTGVAAGADETDAVNVSQLKGVSDRTDQLSQDALLWDPTANGGKGAFSANHGGRGPSKITNVAAGNIDATSTDAVNGSQLYEVTTQINNITLGGIRYFHANSQKPDSIASGADSIAVGPAAQASGRSSLAMGDGANASASNASAIGSHATASADSATAVGTGASATGSSSVAMGEGAAATGERSSAIGAGASAEAANSVALGADSVADRDNSVSVGSAGNERQITNVKAGEADTDAVNVSQLRDHGNTVNSTINNVDNRVTQAKTDITQLQNGTDGMFQVNNSSSLPKPRPTGTDAVAGGAGAEASGNNSAAIGTRARARGANATALGNGSSAQAQNSVALGANSVADRANSVSMGSAGNERQITNLAAGTAPTDAVNVSQLQQSMGDISNQFYDYTDSRYNALRHDLKKQDDILSAGIAGAMAMATLPQPHSAGASMATVGLGNYRGQGALAIGVSRISDNGKWVTKLQGSTSSQGEAGVAVGLGYQW